MAKAVKLSNGLEFSSQKAATEHFRAVLHTYQNGDEVADATHHSDLVALLKRNFATVKHAKPPASRKGSSEWYVVAQGFKGANAAS